MRIVNPVAVIGEDLACEYLRKKGYKILERNFRKGYGELDIICLKDKVLIFVEVKTRTNDKFGSPLEAITYFKLQSLIKTAHFFKLLNPKLPEEMRIDAISILLDKNNNLVNIEHIENITL